MANASLTWADGWAYFKVADDGIKRDFFEQLDRFDWIDGVAPKIQQEILKYAPKEIIHYVKKLLHPETQEFLGFEVNWLEILKKEKVDA